MPIFASLPRLRRRAWATVAPLAFSFGVAFSFGPVRADEPARYDPAAPVAERLAAMGADSTVEDAAAALKDREAAVRAAAVERLAAKGRRARSAAPALAEATDDADANVARRALAALASVGADPSIALPPLVRAVESPEAGRRTAALRAMEAMGPEARPASLAVAAIARSEDAAARRLALRALGAMNRSDMWLDPVGPEGAKRILETIALGLESPDERTRVEATGAAESIGAGAASLVGKLHVAAADSNLSIRLSALRAIGKIGFGEDIGADAARSLEIAIAALADDNRAIRALAAEALGKNRASGRAAAEALATELGGDPDRAVRIEAAKSLGYHAAEADAILPALIAAAEAEEPYVRRAAIRSLGALAEAAAPARGTLERLAAEGAGWSREAEAALRKISNSTSP